MARPRALHQDLPHRQRGNRQEVRAVLPRLVLFLAEPQEGFVHERGGLQRLTRAFLPQVIRREPPQLVVNLRHEFRRVGH